MHKTQYPALVLLTLFFLSSCISQQQLAGSYKTNMEQTNGVISMGLTLNNDGSFVEYVYSHTGGDREFFGTYKRKGRYITLNQLSEDLSYLRKQDMAITINSPFFREKELFIFWNEKMPMASVSVYADTTFLGMTDRSGRIKLPDNFYCDSVIVKLPKIIGGRKTFFVQQGVFNRYYLMVYHYAFVEGVNFSFEGRFKITGRKLKTTIVHLTRGGSSKPVNIYLKLKKVFNEKGSPVSR